MNRVDQALQQFTPDALTCKLLRAVYGVVPYSPKFDQFLSVDDALRSVRPEAGGTDFVRARDMAANGPEVADILWMGRLMDTGDKGYAIATGVFSAINLFRGKGAASLDNDAQQRNDAALKALGIAYMAYKAYPGSLAEKADAFRASPAGQALAVYYAAIEIALPFADNAAMASGDFLSKLFDQEAAGQSSRLASMAGGQNLEGAHAMLQALTGQLQKVVDVAKGYVKPIADAASPYVPGLMGGADKVAGLVASAADVMPVYNLLSARLAAESAARRALYLPG
jgi:hypothetical protein